MIKITASIILIIATVLLCLPLVLASSTIKPILDANADNAAARRTSAESDKVYADAVASAVDTYNDASARALMADTYTAHPWLLLIDAARAGLFLCGGLVFIVVVLFGLAFWRDPGIAVEALDRVLAGAGFTST